MENSRRRLGPLTHELREVRSPVRQFLDHHFAAGLRQVQRTFQEAVPPLAVAPGAANPATVGSAADWLLRFLLHPSPDLTLASSGAQLCMRLGIDAGPALAEIATDLGAALPTPGADRLALTFRGPVAGSAADPDMLARGCWALALLTDAYRSSDAAILLGPLARFRGQRMSGDDLLSLADVDAVHQLHGFRATFLATLVPRLAAYTGLWALGPTFAGSRLMRADADVIAGGLLLDLKTSSKRPAPSAYELFQLVGYVLLDFEDEYRIQQVGIFNARYGHLTAWVLNDLVAELAGQPLDLQDLRSRFRGLLLACTG